MSKDVTFTAGLSDEERPEKKKKWHGEEGNSAREEIHKGKIIPSTFLIVLYCTDLRNNSLFKTKIIRCIQ